MKKDCPVLAYICKKYNCLHPSIISLNMKKQCRLITLFLAPLWLTAQQRIIVDATGKGNYKTIQEAVNSLPDSSAKDRIIFVKNGVYKEQVYIAKAHVVLQGESKAGAIITGAVA